MRKTLLDLTRSRPGMPNMAKVEARVGIGRGKKGEGDEEEGEEEPRSSHPPHSCLVPQSTVNQSQLMCIRGL